LTVRGNEQLPDLNVFTAKLPPDIGSIHARLEVHPEVSGVEFRAPLDVGGGGIAEPEPIRALKGVTSAEVLHRSPNGK
jgi:hypothetical protein